MRILPTIGRIALVIAALPVAGAMAAVSQPAPSGLGAPAPYVAPLAAAPDDGAPFSPVAAGLTLVLPTVAGGFLAAALLRARRMACPPCPACGSRRGAVVGPVGQYHRCCRCHDCGFLWEQDAPGPIAAPSRASRPPEGNR
jgi:hypothetical protein